MPWATIAPVHTCRTPGSFRIWLHRGKPGNGWHCGRCGQWWYLRRRNPTGRFAFWQWDQMPETTGGTTND